MAKKKKVAKKAKKSAKKRPVKKTAKKAAKKSVKKSSAKKRKKPVLSPAKPLIQEGAMAPAFTLPTYGGKMVSLADYRGRTVVLYFYPKDMTPGCTVEACDFRDRMERLTSRGAVVLGVSKDSVARHEKFRDQQNLNFDLLADEDGRVCDAYGVWGPKKMMGNEFMGILRTTYVIAPDGRVKKVFPQVSVTGHVDEVMAVL